MRLETTTNIATIICHRPTNSPKRSSIFSHKRLGTSFATLVQLNFNNLLSVRAIIGHLGQSVVTAMVTTMVPNYKLTNFATIIHWNLDDNQMKIL